jgi:hypothetical protein
MCDHNISGARGVAGSCTTPSNPLQEGLIEEIWTSEPHCGNAGKRKRSIQTQVLTCFYWFYIGLQFATMQNYSFRSGKLYFETSCVRSALILSVLGSNGEVL